MRNVYRNAIFSTTGFAVCITLEIMIKTIAVVAIWLAAFSLAHAEEIIGSPSTEDEQAAINSTNTFIRTVDVGKYDEVWAQVAPELQKTMMRMTFTTGIRVMRSGLGEIKERKLLGLRFIKDLKGAPPGIYAALFLESDFQRLSGQEKIILMKSQGKWMIAGYFFEKSIKFNQR
jgi:Protein of unknown function (DUF4019)